MMEETKKVDRQTEEFEKLKDDSIRCLGQYKIWIRQKGKRHYLQTQTPINYKQEATNKNNCKSLLKGNQKRQNATSRSATN